MKRIRMIRRVVCVMMVLAVGCIGVCAMADKENTANYAVRAVLSEIRQTTRPQCKHCLLGHRLPSDSTKK